MFPFLRIPRALKQIIPLIPRILQRQSTSQLQQSKQSIQNVVHKIDKMHWKHDGCMQSVQELVKRYESNLEWNEKEQIELNHPVAKLPCYIHIISDHHRGRERSNVWVEEMRDVYMRSSECLLVHEKWGDVPKSCKFIWRKR
eukprot:895472_1